MKLNGLSMINQHHNQFNCSLHYLHRRSHRAHRTGCTGHDPTNYWEFNIDQHNIV